MVIDMMPRDRPSNWTHPLDLSESLTSIQEQDTHDW